jgi:hypothetical protein
MAIASGATKMLTKIGPLKSSWAEKSIEHITQSTKKYKQVCQLLTRSNKTGRKKKIGLT